MIKETAVCKKLLKYHFPNESFSVKIRRSHDYSRSSDCLMVRITGNTPIDDVLFVLRNDTFGMCVGRMGKVMFSRDFNSHSMRDPVKNIWVDMGLCEFIEVGYTYD